MISLQTRVTPAESVLFRDLDGEAVILELESGRYFGLDEVGTRFWRALVEHERLDTSLQALLSEYEVTEEQLASDLLGFVETLAASRLLELRV